MFATGLNTQDDCPGWTFSYHSYAKTNKLKSLMSRDNNGSEDKELMFIEIESKSCAIVQREIDFKNLGTVLYKGQNFPAQLTGTSDGKADSGNLVRVIGWKAVELTKCLLIVEPLLRQ